MAIEPGAAAGNSDFTAGEKLRIAVAVGPALSATWCVRDGAGGIKGVAVDLGRELARRLGRAAEIVAYASSGAIVADAAGGQWDVAFVPADEERKRQLSFGPNFFLGESTYLVGANTGVGDLASVDTAGRTIVGIEGTATLRAARRGLKHAKAVGVATMDEVLAMFEAGKADAVALGRESLANLQHSLKRPGTLLNESFHAAGSALAVPPTSDVAGLGVHLEAMKADGALRSIFDRHGLSELPVAPPGSYP